MSLTLWIANKNYSSWSLRPWMALVEAGIEFEEKQVAFTHAGGNPDFIRFSPTAKVPVLQDGELTIWESLAIIEYLAEQHEGIWPQSHQARAWARCAAAEMHAGFSALRNRCPMNCALELRFSSLPEDLARDLARLDQLWCEGLERFGGPFLAGSKFSAVDAFFAPVVFRCVGYGLPLSAPCQSYIKHMLALDSMQQWLSAALKESPEEGHEADSRAYAEIVADKRSNTSD
ncbi:glutathione S-transferase family protein [Carnimonas nigrificans]|uniref:glutathione S-transferase family protein n=1 Tax=Carnimonas nigrificans TaxID=64323 RepID=UPI00046E9B4E|nr:glutathione S-transferase family protein [Carnimonas nigrificans]